MNGDGVVYDRNEAGENSGVESADNGGTENEEHIHETNVRY